MKVAVIGCGPAGLAAAHAAVGRGCDTTVIAPKDMTRQEGPLLLQRPIPGINTEHPDGTIHQIVIGGTIMDYRYKLYGDVNIGINGDILKPRYYAWKHRETYEKLWEKYEHLIVDRMVTRDELAEMHNEFDLVVSTASALTMCRRDVAHNFQFKRVAITPWVSIKDQPENTLIFNADPNVPWVRSSRVFGVPVTEWTIDTMPQYARVIKKPISTDCDCYPHVLRTGRFGKWQNETWIDTAYWDTYEAIDGRSTDQDIRRILDGIWTFAGQDAGAVPDMHGDQRPTLQGDDRTRHRL